ncbi:MarR family transcriptional regulator [Oceanobacillus locisalsi]|uniref:MarR family transcriptional regulator n=1 Tax=Oceanobacillus locisalsi TaxID=546107 RepID=A0ABW3NB61_9BACI
MRKIVKETKLTPPTVSSIVKELIEKGFVIEKELGASQDGRKPTLLYVNSSAFYVVGVGAGLETIRGSYL